MGTAVPACFKAYDIRGKVPDQLDPPLARKIGIAYVTLFQPRCVAVGLDIRLSSPEISEALIEGLLESGTDVLELGLCGTEEVYHASFAGAETGIDGGIMVTASHNPADYNGMKLVTREARPVTAETGLRKIAEMVSGDDLPVKTEGLTGKRVQGDWRERYIDHLMSYIDPDLLSPLCIVANGGNGCAGPVIDLLEKRLPVKIIRLNHQPDGTFPNGVPNPLLPENRVATADLVRSNKADLGLAWDGDFDRCFFWDEKARFIDGYYLVGLLAREMLVQEPGGKILHDPRLIWNTREIVSSSGGIPIATRTGHALIKERMRQEDSIYGGEMSAHHYFRDFGYCDSGMIPWLLVCSMISRRGVPLSQMVDEMMQAYPISGEINTTVDDPAEVLRRVEEHYVGGEIDRIDGLSIAFDSFRFNIRESNTEPLLRLNVESRGDAALMQSVTEQLLTLINTTD